MNLKKLLILNAVGLVVLIAFAGNPKTPPVFQMRLVLDAPSADTERMTNIMRFGDINSTNIYNVQKTVLLDQTAIKSAKAATDTLGHPTIEINFLKQGAKQFAEITKKNINQRLAIVLDGKLCEVPVIRAEITGGQAVICGNFNDKEIKELVQEINEAAPKK